MLNRQRSSNWTRFQFFDRMKLWFNTGELLEPKTRGDLDNTIVGGEAFHAEVSSHPTPVERNVVAALANAPGVLDFYMLILIPIAKIHAGPGPPGLLSTADAVTSSDR